MIQAHKLTAKLFIIGCLIASIPTEGLADRRSATSSRNRSAKARGYLIAVGVGELDRNRDPEYAVTQPISQPFESISTMQRLTDSLGFEPAILLSGRQANTVAFFEAITSISQRASSEDLIVIYFTGHGSMRRAETRYRVTTNYEDPTDPTKVDYNDGTLGFYDRQLIDEELLGVYSKFPKDSRIFFIVETCNSLKMTDGLQSTLNPKLRPAFAIPPQVQMMVFGDGITRSNILIHSIARVLPGFNGNYLEFAQQLKADIRYYYERPGTPDQDLLFKPEIFTSLPVPSAFISQRPFQVQPD